MATDRDSVMECMLSKMAPSSRYSYELYKKRYMEFQPETPHSSKRICEWIIHEHTNGAKATSLWPMGSHVFSYLEIELGIEIERKQVHKLIKSLEKTTASSKADAFTAEQIFAYVSSLDDSDSTIVMRLYILFSYFAAARKSEMIELNFCDVIPSEKENGIYINMHRKKARKVQKGKPKFACKNTNPRCCPLELYKRYSKLRPQEATRFFLYFRNGHYCNMPIGKDAFDGVPERIAKFHSLVGHYTTHSFRASAATTFLENNGSIQQLMHLGDWQSSSVCDGYIRESKRLARNNGLALMPRSDTQADTKVCGAQGGDQTEPSPKHRLQAGGNVFSGCNFSECTLVIHLHPKARW